MRAIGGRLLALLSLALVGPRATGAWTGRPPRVVADRGSGFAVSEREYESGGSRVVLRVVSFDDRRHRLRVVDNPRGGEVSLAEAMRREGCDAGINGGFFHADWTPLGLMVSGGRVVHPVERARLLSGVLAVTAEMPLLMRFSEYRFGPKTMEGLQAGPFLVDRGAAVPGLENRKRDRRSVVATDGHHRWALVATGPIALGDLATILAGGDGATGFEISRALNLDGGSSTALWAAGAESVACREVGFVRNFLGVAARGNR